jgi:hypothetical protein
MKRCSECKKEKSLTEFHKNKFFTDGFAYTCKQCKASYRLAHRIKNKSQPVDTHKVCIKCGQDKQSSEFIKNRGLAGGLVARCKACSKHKVKIFGTDYDELTSRNHGITQEQYKQLLVLQDNRCAVCQTPFSATKTTAIDHDHSCCPGNYSCGKCVRGIVCTKCNVGLGMFDDNPQILVSAVRYLGKFIPGTLFDNVEISLEEIELEYSLS